MDPVQTRSRLMPGKTSAGVLAAIAVLMCAPSFAAESVEINDLVIASPLNEPQAAAALNAIRAFYDFWNTGDEALLKQAVAANFTDRTLPPGRPQGPEGPAFASRQFRSAVPDLKVTVEKMIVAGSYTAVHMRFTGHFPRKLGQAQGNRQEISFTATEP